MADTPERVALGQIKTVLQACYEIYPAMSWYAAATCIPADGTCHLEIGLLVRLLLATIEGTTPAPPLDVVLTILNGWIRGGTGRASEACRSQALVANLLAILGHAGSGGGPQAKLVIEAIAMLTVASTCGAEAAAAAAAAEPAKTDEDAAFALAAASAGVGKTRLVVDAVIEFLRDNMAKNPTACTALLAALRQVRSISRSRPRHPTHPHPTPRMPRNREAGPATPRTPPHVCLILPF